MNRPEHPMTSLAPPRGFSRVETWIFDLDNTLYPSQARLWPQVDERITLYLAELFGLDGLSARALQKFYYERYGTTLRGLMEEHHLDPAEFLDFAHRIDLRDLAPNPGLGAAIAALPGRKLILTNGSRLHAENVAGKLGIRGCFEDIFDIEAAAYIPKPERAAYERFLERHEVDPAKAAMFEDLAKNLVAPDALGMTTVLVLPDAPDPFRAAREQEAVTAPYIHYITRDLAAFLAEIILPRD